MSQYYFLSSAIGIHSILMWQQRLSDVVRMDKTLRGEQQSIMLEIATQNQFVY